MIINGFALTTEEELYILGIIQEEVKYTYKFTHIYAWWRSARFTGQFSSKVKSGLQEETSERI